MTGSYYLLKQAGRGPEDFIWQGRMSIFAIIPGSVTICMELSLAQQMKRRTWESMVTHRQTRAITAKGCERGTCSTKQIAQNFRYRDRHYFLRHYKKY